MIPPDNHSKHGGDLPALPPSNGMRAFETLGQYLRQDGWQPQRDPERKTYRMLYSGQNGEYKCYAQIMPHLEQLLFYAIVPVKTPDNLRPAVAEFITRANYGIRIGNFEMDYSDGEVRYKSSLDFEGHQLTPGLIRSAIYPAVLTLDHYLPGLLNVIYGGQTPQDAISEIERQNVEEQ